MHELAVLNGTLKEIDLKCLNCGRLGHKSWECDERPNFTSAIICQACGGVGHLSKLSVQFHGQDPAPKSQTGETTDLKYFFVYHLILLNPLFA